MASPDNTFLDTKVKVRAGSIQCKKTRDLKILKIMDKLKEACECNDTNCPNPDCDDMKCLVVHSKFCTIYPKKCCHLCKNLLAMCRYHAKRSRGCDSEHCSFPYCAEIKHSLMLKNKQNNNQGVIYTCNKCKKYFETGYNCTICVNFDICVICYERESHPHMMKTISFQLDKSVQKQTTSQDSRKLLIQRCIDYLVPVCQCKDLNCCLIRCMKMKQIITHTKVCIRKATGDCLICKQLIAFCCYHTKYCEETKCQVPFCSNIKHKFRRHLQQRPQQAQLLLRGMEVQADPPWYENGLEIMLESLYEEPLNLSVDAGSTSSSNSG